MFLIHIFVYHIYTCVLETYIWRYGVVASLLPRGFVCVCVCVGVRSCNRLKLKNTWIQSTHIGQSIWHVFEETVIVHLFYLFVKQFCFPTGEVKKILQELNNPFDTTCSQYVHGLCVAHARKNTELSKARSHMIKSNKSREIGRLGCLERIQQVLHDPKPPGAQTRGRYRKNNKPYKPSSHMLLFSLTDCLLFVVFVGVCWWPTGSGSEKIFVVHYISSNLIELSQCIYSP